MCCLLHHNILSAGEKVTTISRKKMPTNLNRCSFIRFTLRVSTSVLQKIKKVPFEDIRHKFFFKKFHLEPDWNSVRFKIFSVKWQICGFQFVIYYCTNVFCALAHIVRTLFNYPLTFECNLGWVFNSPDNFHWIYLIPLHRSHYFLTFSTVSFTPRRYEDVQTSCSVCCVPVESSRVEEVWIFQHHK